MSNFLVTESVVVSESFPASSFTATFWIDEAEKLRITPLSTTRRLLPLRLTEMTSFPAVPLMFKTPAETAADIIRRDSISSKNRDMIAPLLAPPTRNKTGADADFGRESGNCSTAGKHRLSR